MHAAVGLGLRGFLLLASAVVLGLSVTLAKNQKYGSPPTETSFASFTGAFGIIAAAVGAAALFFDSLPQLVPLVTDGLAALFFLAGGIALAVAMKGISCTDTGAVAGGYRYLNKILNGGCTTLPNSELKSRCTQTQADFAFQFIAAVAALGALVMTFLTSKRSGNGVFV